jgi:hypothetical protein
MYYKPQPSDSWRPSFAEAHGVTRPAAENYESHDGHSGCPCPNCGSDQTSCWAETAPNPEDNPIEVFYCNKCHMETRD